MADPNARPPPDPNAAAAPSQAGDPAAPLGADPTTAAAGQQQQQQNPPYGGAQEQLAASLSPAQPQKQIAQPSTDMITQVENPPTGAGAAAADFSQTNPPPGGTQQTQISQQQNSLAHENSQQQQAPDNDSQAPDLSSLGQIRVTDTVGARLGATGVMMVQSILSLASTFTDQLRSSLSQDIIEHAAPARNNFLPSPKFGTTSHPDPKSIKSLLQQMGSVKITCLCRPEACTMVFKIFKCAKEIIEEAGLNERAGLLLLQPCFGGRLSPLLSHCLRKGDYCAFQAYMQDAAC